MTGMQCAIKLFCLATVAPPHLATTTASYHCHIK